MQLGMAFSNSSAVALLSDPVTREPLVDPVLASDGHTYSLESLRQVMRHDCFHRSPVTQEVLRRAAFVNCVAVALLSKQNTEAKGSVTPETSALVSAEIPNCVWLWDADNDAACAVGAAGTDDAECIRLTLPARVKPLLAAALCKTGMGCLGGSGVTLQVTAMHDGASGTKILLHCPPPEQAWDACVELCAATFGKGAFRNPWCIAGAKVLLAGSGTDTHASAPKTVEEYWLESFKSQARK
jgi:hypothetical protein